MSLKIKGNKNRFSKRGRTKVWFHGLGIESVRMIVTSCQGSAEKSSSKAVNSFSQKRTK